MVYRTNGLGILSRGDGEILRKRIAYAGCIIAFLGALTVIWLSDLQRPFFGKARWGMSEVSVRALMPNAKVKKESNLLLAKGLSLEGIPAEVIYVFEKNALIGGVYRLLRDDSGDPDGFMKDYESVERSLIKRYGKPNTFSASPLTSTYCSSWSKRMGYIVLYYAVDWSNGVPHSNFAIVYCRKDKAEQVLDQYTKVVLAPGTRSILYSIQLRGKNN